MSVIQEDQSRVTFINLYLTIFIQRPRAGEQQDFFISQLKQEIYELRQRQRDYSQLAEQMSFLEKKFRQLQDDKRVGERECDNKINQNLQYIDQLIKELDYLKSQNENEEYEQEQVLQKIRDVNGNLVDRVEEYNQLRAQMSVVEGKNFAERKDIERLDSDLRDATSTSHKFYQDIARLKDIQNARELDNRGFKARIDQMESDLDSNNRRIAQLNEVREQRDEDIGQVNMRISSEQQNINQLRVQIQKVDNEIQYVENQNNKHQQQQIQLSKINEQEYFRGKDQAGIEAERRITLKSREDEFAALRFEIETVKQANARYIEDQYELQNETEALKTHMNTLNQQNFELSTELEKFIESDETIKRTLNRKGKVEEIRHKVDEAIMKSMIEVQNRRSPERVRNDSPQRRY